MVGGTAGGIDIDFITIPTGEPDCRYSTKYAILDSNGDKIPDLHIKSVRYYYLLTYVDDELRILKNLSPNPQYYALNNEAFISILYGPSGDEYHYFKLDILGNEVGIVNFSKRDTNQNGFFDDADEYSFNEQNVSKEEWDTLTEPYLYTDEEGRECIKNKIEWTVFCE